LSDWCTDVKLDPHTAYCKVCHKTFSIPNMGLCQIMMKTMNCSRHIFNQFQCICMSSRNAATWSAMVSWSSMLTPRSSTAHNGLTKADSSGSLVSCCGVPSHTSCVLSAFILSLLLRIQASMFILNIRGIMSIEAFLLEAQLRCVGHIMQMSDSRVPKQVILGQLAVGKCLQCGPVLWYKDALKVSMKQCNMDSPALSSDTQDRSAWRTLCHETVNQFEDL